MACVFYGLNSWLPDAYVERGWSEGKAGALLAVLNIAALMTTLIIPWLADRRGSRRLYFVVFSVLLAGSCAGFAGAPGFTADRRSRSQRRSRLIEKVM